MKETTKRLLIWLYGEGDLWIPTKQLPLILPGSTPESRKSLLFYLSNQRYIHVQRIEKETWVALTPVGKEKLEEVFPVFSRQRMEWQGKWQVIVFIKAPKGDANFRYLREILVQAKAFSITRGVFLFPGEIPLAIQSTLQKLYRTSVIVFTTTSWSTSEAQLFLSQNSPLTDLVSVYSGISKQISSLLAAKNNKKGLEEHLKQQISIMYTQLYETIQIDDGIVFYIFPQVPRLTSLLTQLREILV